MKSSYPSSSSSLRPCSPPPISNSSNNHRTSSINHPIGGNSNSSNNSYIYSLLPYFFKSNIIESSSSSTSNINSSFKESGVVGGIGIGDLKLVTVMSSSPSTPSISPLNTDNNSIEPVLESTSDSGSEGKGGGSGDYSSYHSSSSNINIHNNNNRNDGNISSNGLMSTSPPKVSGNKDRPISLPNQSSPIKHFALDIGGTLAKLVYFVQNQSGDLGGKLHFIKFQTKNIEDCFNFIIENKLHLEDGKPKMVRVTGGGAYKYADLFEQKLGCTLVKEDEMFCLIKGTNFLLNNIYRESFTYSPIINNSSPKEFIDKAENPYPYLLVQIGSGVSVIKVDSETSFQRVDGTSLGGGTFWGLCSLLTGVTDFDEMLEMTKHGHSNTVDLVVGDIYGTDYSKVGLSSDTIASSFGKIIYQQQDENTNNLDNQASNRSSGSNQPKYKKEDIAQSLLKMVSNNIGQIAYLNSQRYGLNKIYFGGFFIRDHPNTMQRISFAIDFWSKGKTKAMFLVHDGYLGALGAFLGPPEPEEKHINEGGEQESWLRRTTREFQRLFSSKTTTNTTTTTTSTPTTPTTAPTTSNLRTSNNNNPITTNRPSTTSSILINIDEMKCDCGQLFCEELVCKVEKLDDHLSSSSYSSPNVKQLSSSNHNRSSSFDHK